MCLLYCIFLLTKTNKTNKNRKIHSGGTGCKIRTLPKWYDDIKSSRDLARADQMRKTWYGLNYCPECGLYNKYCNCVFEAHSGLETANGTTNDNSIMKVAGDSKYENVKFSDQIDPYMYSVDSVMDPTRMLQDTNDATLENFFSRPIKIAEEEWGTSTTLGFDIDPWTLYFTNPRVANRIANFNLLRCNLKIKVVINGNGFQYGRALVSYLPFETFDTLSSNAALIREDLVQASQQPRIFLDPTTSLGGEMSLPFFNYWNYINIPEGQWSEMGSLFFRSLNTLKHANGATDLVTISVFAWAEDVSLSVLTSDESDGLVPQSGLEVDEVNAKGTVSGPATAIAKVAGTMTRVPYIGPFASATEMAANTTAAIAKMFGYCRPPVTKNPEPYKPYAASQLALTNTGDGPTKLSVDEKQELTVDPRIAGLSGIDSLNIKEIAKRESYLTSFNWNIGTSPETLLWNARIDPVTWAENSGPPTSYHFPACAMAAMPFRYWTGTMRFRFQIVCSAFHKGRLKFVYDPNRFASNEYNTNYTTIVDIADKQDFTLEVANGQDKTLLTHSLPGVVGVTQMYSTTPYTVKASFGNGALGVYVVNELTTPNSDVNNDIEINVFVSMGDDFEVFVPDDHFQHFVAKPLPGEGGGGGGEPNFARIPKPRHMRRATGIPYTILSPVEEEQKVGAPYDEFQPQSGAESTIVSESQNTSEPSAPQQEIAEKLGPTMSDNSDINKVFTGESIASFRTMLKRYNLWHTVGLLDNTATRISGSFSIFPFLRGSVDGAVFNTNTGAPYNYCNTVLMHWVTLAHQGWRGGIRYKWLPRGAISADHRPTLYVQRHPPGEIEYSYSNSGIPTYGSAKDAAAGSVIRQGTTPRRDAPFSGVRGQAYQSGYLNPAIEIEMPFYSQRRFSPGKEENHTDLNEFHEGFDYYLSSLGDPSTVWDIHVAAAEDFQVFFFTGLPRMYYEFNAPS